MKKLKLLCPVLFMLALFVFPGAVGLCFSPSYKSSDSVSFREDTVSPSYTISCLDTNENKIIKLDIEDYLPGVLAAEMPASYEPEALKAQAVAARSFIISRCQNISDDHPDADICTDFSHCKAWLSKADALKKWKKEDRDLYWEKLCNAVRSTKGEYMVYENEVVEAFFFANSGGKTEASEDVWGGKRPYLKSVSSDWDTTSPDVSSSVSIPVGSFMNVLKTETPGISSPSVPQIGDITFSEGGSVSKIIINGQTFTGNEIRRLFGLKSAKFKVSVDDDIIVFSVMGNGHGVGMSQYGANYMAKSGKKYTDILSHYYSNIQIVSF